MSETPIEIFPTLSDGDWIRSPDLYMEHKADDALYRPPKYIKVKKPQPEGENANDQK